MTSYIQSNGRSGQWLGVGVLKKMTDSMFPEDDDLAFWIWKILLRDVLFFQLMYPGWDLKGCQYQLEVRHVCTGQTRQEWIADKDSEVYDVFDLLNPHLWLIELESLMWQYHKLFVYQPDWRCPDATDHSKWLTRWSPADAERNIDHLVSRDERATWERQVYVQRINPCVYSLLEWWLVVATRPYH